MKLSRTLLLIAIALLLAAPVASAQIYNSEASRMFDDFVSWAEVEQIECPTILVVAIAEYGINQSDCVIYTSSPATLKLELTSLYGSPDIGYNQDGQVVTALWFTSGGGMYIMSHDPDINLIAFGFQN